MSAVLACACSDSSDGGAAQAKRMVDPPAPESAGITTAGGASEGAAGMDAPTAVETGSANENDASVSDDCHVVAADVNVGNGCAVTAAGFVYCWGLAGLGELGRAEARDRCAVGRPELGAETACSLQPVRVPGVRRAVDVSIVGSSVCALDQDGAVQCWGSNWQNALGARADDQCENPYADLSSPSRTTPCSADPVAVVGLGRVSQLSAWGETCALADGGEVHCWGAAHAAATAVPNVQDAIGTSSSCALQSDGGVRCWGSAESGRLGTREPIGTCSGPYNQPCTLSGVPVELQAKSIDVSSGWHHACAVSEQGEVWCWGHNGYGQLGIGRESQPCASGFPCEPSPQQVPELRDVARVFAGIGSTCALTTDGRALCWGNLPIEGLPAGAAHMREVSLPGRVTDMSSERSGICFALADGALYCAGLRYLAPPAGGTAVLASSLELQQIDVCGG